MTVTFLVALPAAAGLFGVMLLLTRLGLRRIPGLRNPIFGIELASLPSQEGQTNGKSEKIVEDASHDEAPSQENNLPGDYHEYDLSRPRFSSTREIQMNSVGRLTGWTLCFAAFALIASPARSGGTFADRDRIAQGILKNRELINPAPDRLYISNQKEFKKLWKVWCGNKKLPTIDFHTSIVVVGTVKRPAIPAFRLRIDKKGDLTIIVGSVLIKDDGRSFGYAMDVVPRDGIKTIDGKPISNQRRPQRIENDYSTDRSVGNGTATNEDDVCRQIIDLQKLIARVYMLFARRFGRGRYDDMNP